MTDPGKLIELDVKPRSRIIVADDEQDIATLIEDWLSDTYEVTVALNGKAAIQKAIWQRPDVILCDIVMPDMGGYEVARALQANPTTQGVPMIVMTAKNYDDSTVRMIKAEPNVLGFINKPFKPSELIKMIQSV
ncbi:MAG TPA: response regulator, partial [Elusimicrobiota bacterium]|nr:response regulator [Elusimicrobiota bacterium]